MTEDVGPCLVFILCLVCLWVALCEVNEDLKK